MSNRAAAVIVLAAGEGTRMRSAVPKVLHQIAGKSLLGHALVAAAEVEPARLAVVVRHQRDLVAEHVAELGYDALIADQDEIPGTGRAVQCALSALDAAGMAQLAHDGAPDQPLAPDAGQLSGPVVVTSGDVPLLDGATLVELVNTHQESGASVTILSASIDDATGYGRIVRESGTAEVSAIAEEKDATEEQRKITEFNAGVYVFDAGVLRGALSRITTDNAQGEMYLTDVVSIVKGDGGSVRAVQTDDPWLVEGVNDRVQLAALGAELNRRILEEHMRAGVTIVDPATTWIDSEVLLSQDVTILPNTHLAGNTVVGQGATIGPDTSLKNITVGPESTVIRTHGTDSVIGAGSDVGPFAYLRPGTVLGERGKIGSFVETKNAEIGDGTKVPHLSYVGDADIGEETNIGAGTIFVNFDGVNKHRTEIGSHARTGAANMFVAPLKIGDGAYTGAGAVVRRDVPPGALSVSNAPQRNIEGWVLRSRAGTPAADAAASALSSDPATDPTLSRQAREQLNIHHSRQQSNQQGEPNS
ncbi:MAG TPA: bifunctional UDP-N-acetylglucosamine diphosphorylase/glucosamine-1-phosphate N-acetyltransferase GlmU [Actinomycetales bacterium]|nr:bifunctional UDP-N-acetylglucosamine diphosphorylase/glucosamine-1-phosphate N-acetyltransferase GlmU [Actinomycetales bacterium]